MGHATVRRHRSYHRPLRRQSVPVHGRDPRRGQFVFIQDCPKFPFPSSPRLKPRTTKKSFHPAGKIGGLGCELKAANLLKQIPSCMVCHCIDSYDMNLVGRTSPASANNALVSASAVTTASRRAFSSAIKRRVRGESSSAGIACEGSIHSCCSCQISMLWQRETDLWRLIIPLCTSDGADPKMGKRYDPCLVMAALAAEHR